MNYSLLRDEIKQIQQEYKNLLSNLLPLLKAKRSMVALDEINLFWARHIDIVKLYLKTELSVMNSYVFTAATYMDIEDKEQYPFLLLGDQHILDDPLCKYAEICIKMPDGIASELLYQQIVKAAEDDIRVINTCEDQIVILPLRLLNSPKEDNPLLNLGEQIFLSMFPDINSMETYVQKCSNFSDIVRYGIPNLSEIIMFSEDDDRATPFEERFRAAINNAPGMVDKTKSDAENFFMLVYGFIQQAIDVIVSCEEYRCIPYIRYPVALNYISLIAGNLLHMECIREMCFKMSIAFVVYNLCDKEKLSQAGFTTFLSCRDKICFSDKLFASLEEKGITYETYLKHPVREYVSNALLELYEIITPPKSTWLSRLIARIKRFLKIA